MDESESIGKGIGEDRAGGRVRRRGFLRALATGGALAAGGAGLGVGWWALGARERRVFVGRAASYGADLERLMRAGLAELGIGEREIRGRRILLKPNLIESTRGVVHRTTHPATVRAAAAAFRGMGAGEVFVAEGSGHCADAMRVLDESGMAEALLEDRLRYVDLNTDDVYTAPNAGGLSRLRELTLPSALARADWIVSMPKMKTHHWVGVTLSMKNLLGVMPGSFYGWPKNVLHWAGLPEVILDIHRAVRAHLAIVDGIVGMEGDGPIMGEPREAGLLVMGRDLPSVDETCVRLMGLVPSAVPYLCAARVESGGGIREVGERVDRCVVPFRVLPEMIPAHAGLRGEDHR